MKFSLLLFFIILTSATAVRAQDVAVDFDKGADFSRFRTYSWGSGVMAKNPLIDRQIRARIEEHLAARGLSRVDEGGNLSVLYISAIDREVQVSTSNWKYTGNWMGQAVSGISAGSQMWDVEIGTLIVCLFDASGKNLLWRGVSKTMLDKRSTKQKPLEAMREDAQRVEKKVKKSLEKMFRQYPVAKSSG